jgi:hypothetical protein
MRLTNKRTWPEFLDAVYLEVHTGRCEILYCLRRTPVFASGNFPGHRRLPDDHAHHIRRAVGDHQRLLWFPITIRQTENP